MAILRYHVGSNGMEGMARNVAYPQSHRVIDLGPNNDRLEAIAEEIAIDRGRAIVEVACHMAAIRSLQSSAKLGANARITCVKASVQDTKARSGHQAAHLLPGQIKVNGRPVWLLANPRTADPSIRQAVTRLQLQTIAAFAETNVLPSAFNRADSQAERIAASSGVPGLKRLFAMTTEQMWKSCRVDSDHVPGIDRKAIFRMLGDYFTGASRVYAAACERKMNAWVKADHRGKSSSAERRELEARVLQAYHFSLKIGVAGNFVRRHVNLVYARYA